MKCSSSNQVKNVTNMRTHFLIKWSQTYIVFVNRWSTSKLGRFALKVFKSSSSVWTDSSSLQRFVNNNACFALPLNTHIWGHAVNANKRENAPGVLGQLPSVYKCDEKHKIYLTRRTFTWISKTIRIVTSPRNWDSVLLLKLSK